MAFGGVGSKSYWVVLQISRLIAGWYLDQARCIRRTACVRTLLLCCHLPLRLASLSFFLVARTMLFMAWTIEHWCCHCQACIRFSAACVGGAGGCAGGCTVAILLFDSIWKRRGTRLFKCYSVLVMLLIGASPTQGPARLNSETTCRNSVTLGALLTLSIRSFASPV